MNLRLPNSKTLYSLPLMTHVDQWRGGVHGSRISAPIRNKLIPGKSTTAARNVDRIRNRYSNNECSTNGIERQSGVFFSWLLLVFTGCYFWLRHHRWRFILSVFFLLAHFSLEVGARNGLSVSTVLQYFGTWYIARLSANPIVTKSISAGVIGTIGDYAAQWLEHIISSSGTEKRTANKCSFADSTIEPQSVIMDSVSIHGQYHLRRGLAMLADGLFISGPLMHFGYEVFENLIPIASTGPASALAAMIHVAADSLILDSFFVASRFFTTGFMEGIPLDKLLPQFCLEYLPSLKASWVTSVFMCPVQFSCFRYMPLSFRVLSVNCIDVIWDAILSFMAHRSR